MGWNFQITDIKYIINREIMQSLNRIEGVTVLRY